MISLANVRDDRHIAFVEAKSGAQDASASGLQHGHFDFGIHQHVASAQRAAAIAFVDASIVDGIDTSMLHISLNDGWIM